MAIQESLTVTEALALPSDTAELAQARGLVVGLAASATLLLERRKEVAGGDVAISESAALEGLSLDEQAEHLRANKRLLIDAYAFFGTRVGAERMDAARVARGEAPVHAAIVARLWDDPRCRRRFDAGTRTITDDRRRGVTLSYFGNTVELVQKHIDARLAEPNVAILVAGSDVQGRDRGDGFLNPSMRGVMRSEEWPEDLRALALALGMNAMAMRSVRRMVDPALDATRDAPTVAPGAESLFWEARLFGSAQDEGICYWLGYINKSRAILKGYMESIWPGETERNYTVLMSALLLRPASLGPDWKNEIRDIRKSVFRAIGEGDFAGAEQQLRVLAAARPRLFFAIGLEYFTRNVHNDPTDFVVGA